MDSFGITERIRPVAAIECVRGRQKSPASTSSLAIGFRAVARRARIACSAVRLVQQRFAELEFLSDAALALSELPLDEDVFRFIAERLALIAPNSLVMTISYDACTGLATVRAASRPDEMLRTARELAGEPVGQVLAVDNEARRILSEGKLSRVEGGMHQRTFRQWPAALWQRFEEQLAIRSVYDQPFARKGGFLGAVAFASREASLEHGPLIEVFVRPAGGRRDHRRHARQAAARLPDGE